MRENMRSPIFDLHRLWVRICSFDLYHRPGHDDDHDDDDDGGGSVLDHVA